MAEDLRQIIENLLQAGDIETATVTVVLKARSPQPPQPADGPVAVFKIGPVTTKE